MNLEKLSTMLSELLKHNPQFKDLEVRYFVPDPPHYEQITSVLLPASCDFLFLTDTTKIMSIH